MTEIGQAPPDRRSKVDKYVHTSASVSETAEFQSSLHSSFLFAILILLFHRKYDFSHVEIVHRNDRGEVMTQRGTLSHCHLCVYMLIKSKDCSVHTRPRAWGALHRLLRRLKIVRPSFHSPYIRLCRGVSTSVALHARYISVTEQVGKGAS